MITPLHLLIAGTLDVVGTAASALEGAYKVVMVREVYTFGRDVLVALGLGHVLHIQHRRLRAAYNSYRRRRPKRRG